MWWSNYSENTQETSDSWFCNVVGCKTQISIKLGCSPGKFTWKVKGEQSCKSQLIKVTNPGKPPRMFSLACNLMISRKKICELN